MIVKRQWQVSSVVVVVPLVAAIATTSVVNEVIDIRESTRFLRRSADYTALLTGALSISCLSKSISLDYHLEKILILPCLRPAGKVYSQMVPWLWVPPKVVAPQMLSLASMMG